MKSSWMERDDSEFPRPPKDTHNEGGRGSPTPQPRKPAGQFFSVGLGGHLTLDYSGRSHGLNSIVEVRF